MILIDEGASGKLIQALKALPDLENMYCIHFKQAVSELRTHLVYFTQGYLPDADIYFCENGEAFLLAPDAGAKECRKVMLKVASALNIKPADAIGDLYDLEVDMGALLSLLDQKTKSGRKTEEELKKQQAHMEAIRRKQEILNGSTFVDVKNIAARRAERKVPQLMIIEDDAFSRRLVENILQKQYKLTGLEDAEVALATYANLAPDLLFLDINLPDVSGHELLERIIAMDPEAYVVMLSGNADKANIMQAMGKGAKGFVAKPFNREKLFQYIERCPSIRKESLNA